jgi:hypothetical protein
LHACRSTLEDPPVLDYMKRMFDRPTFQMSLTEVEREMRDRY